jgi:hypothetical protein
VSKATIKKLEQRGITLVQATQLPWPADTEVVHEELDGQPPVATTKGWGQVPGRPT